MSDYTAVRPGVPGSRTPGARRTGSIWAASRLGAGEGADAPADRPADASRFINRELSWLEFGGRLLQLSADERIPLSERVKFLCIFSEGLDEFFQVRVAGLEDQVAAGLRTRSPDGLSPVDQLEAITARVTGLVEWQGAVFRDHLVPALADTGVTMTPWASLDPDGPGPSDRGVQPQHLPDPHPAGRRPGPSLPLHLRSVRSISWSGWTTRRRVRGGSPGSKCRHCFPGSSSCPTGARFVPIEQVIAAHLGAMFPDMDIAEHHAFRVTRNADLSVERTRPAT